MKVTILCCDASHPVNAYLNEFARELNATHEIEILRSRDELRGGDFLFLVSCSELIKEQHKAKYRYTLVMHASDLPEGRGWSPHIWDIINGREVITLSLLEAEQKVDSGRIWLKVQIPISKSALWDEVNHILFKTEIMLMKEALTNHAKIKPYQQDVDIEPTYHRKRAPEDSRVDANSSIADQFDLIRMCDPHRYPAWFEIHGKKYKLILEKLDSE